MCFWTASVDGLTKKLEWLVGTASGFEDNLPRQHTCLWGGAARAGDDRRGRDGASAEAAKTVVARPVDC
jgi:hypothetical protein